MMQINNNSILSSAILLFAFSGLFTASASTDTSRTYSFAIVPQQAASKMARSWNPILKHITNETGIKLAFKTAKNIPAFEKELAAGIYDLAYMNPYHYVTFSKTSGYRAFAKAKNKLIHGIVVVHKDSKYQSLQDLAGQKLAFPSPLAFAASILPRGELQQRDISFKPYYVSSHDSVYQNVAAKTFVAGGGVMRTYKATTLKIRKQLRVLYKTPGYTPHAFASHSRVPPEIIKSIMQAMSDMDGSSAGKSLLNVLKIQGIEAAEHKQWNDVQALKLDQ